MGKMYIKTKGRFTVKEIIAILEKLLPDREVVCAIDEEWNDLKELAIDVSELKEVVFFPV